MSIADKLTYLNTTKQLLKTEINKINNVLDDNSTFRSYPQELFNGYLDILNNGTDTLWNNLEKVSASGEEATLENVETAPIKMVLNGNTIQDGTPTPDTPVEVKVVKGENVVSVQGKNLFDTNYLTQEEGYNTYNEETGLWSTSTLANYGRSFFYNVVGSSAIRDITKLIKLKANTNYSIKFYDITDNTSGGGSGNTIQIFVVDSDGKSISLIDGSGTLVGRILTAGTTTFRTIEECWLDIRRAGSSGNYTFSNVMLVEGTYTKNNFPDYVPYSKTDYPINLPVENLINSSLFTISGSYNVTSINNGEVVGTSISNYAGVRIALGQNVSLKTNDVIYVRLKMKSDVAGDVFNTIQLFNSSNANITSTETKISIPTLTTDYQEYVMKFVLGTDDTLNKLFIQHKGSSSNVFTIKDIQVSYINGSYTTYGTTPIELCKINTYKNFPFKAINGNEYYDSLTEEQKNALTYGSWYVHKEIGKVVLDGNNKRVAYSNVYNNIYQFYYLVSSTLTNYNQNAIYVFTNFFKGVVWAQNWTIDNSSALQNNGNLRLNTSKFNNANDFNLWLTTHNTIVYYVLATPTEEEITNTTLIEQLEAISKAKSVKDKTYITQTNEELPFILDVEAIKEYSVE